MSCKSTHIVSLLLLAAACSSAGCRQINHARGLYQPPPPQTPLGTTSDTIWQMQERNAEASDFVVYQHEFRIEETSLNTSGQNHLVEIAYRLQGGQDYPVVVEKSTFSVRPGTEFEYPVHPNPALDMDRRAVVVAALEKMGVTDAERRVVVAPAFAPGQQAGEAVGAYQRGLRSFGGFGGLGGGFFGGGFGGFGGGFGGFGGGFF